MVVYKITNLITNKFYVGKDEGNSSDYMGSGKWIKNSINKHGIENFSKEILEVCNDSDHLIIQERFWIKELDANNPDVGYNLTDGGDGGNTFKYKTEEEMVAIKKKISEGLKAGKGGYFSKEHRRKLSEAAKRRKGNKPCKFKGMKYEDYMDPESLKIIKEKISEAGRRPMSEKVKNNLRLNAPNRTEVTIDGIKYVSIQEARRETGLSYIKIKKLANK